MRSVNLSFAPFVSAEIVRNWLSNGIIETNFLERLEPEFTF